MGLRGLFEGWHIVLLLVLVILLFGWKRLPDASRSLGRSLRIFKSEMGEMRNDSRPGAGPSAASSDTVRGERVRDDYPPRADDYAPRADYVPPADAARPATDPAREQPPAPQGTQTHHQPPA